MTVYDFFEARRWVDDYKNTTGGAKAYVAHQLANVAPALLRAVDEQAAKIERRRVRLVEAENDLLNVRGILSPNGHPRRLPADVELVPNVAPAVEWLANRVDELTARLEAAHDALSRVDGGDEDSMATLESTVTYVVGRWQHLCDAETAAADKVDEVTAERDHANNQLAEEAATVSEAWAALDRAGFHSPVDTIAVLIDELSAALAKSQKQAATLANEVGALTAENARVRQQRDAYADVVEAAKAWRDSDDIQLVGVDEIGEELVAAVDALLKVEATR